MGDATTEFRSLFGGIVEQNTFAFTCIKIFLDDYVHGVEGVEHFVG